MMEFNHLDDTRFPNFDTVHPYQFKNEFDYSRWVPGTRIKACNVPWDYAYENVVKFDSDSERDSYFDSIEQNRVEILDVDARVLPENYVKLPIPFDMMAGYNYLVIDIPIATGSEPIDYESGTGFRRWHFFITDMQYLAPNSTQVFVQLDVWTQFINSVDIPYMMLERGHAPVAATNVDDFLADPLANNSYLLAPDVNYGEATITAKAENKTFMSGRKWICLVTVYNDTAMASPDTYFGKRYQSAQFAAGTPYYTDSPERWGYQNTPNDYGFGNGYSYLNCRSNTSLYNETQTLAPNNVQIYAIEAEDCFTRKSEHGNEGFFERVFRDRPTFTNGILAMFMVGESMIDLDGTYFTIDTFRLYRVKQQYVNSMSGIRLDKDDFALPDNIADFAKLYTYPYSSIELSDNDGNKREIRVEDISGDNRLIYMTSLAFPYLNFRTLFSGIGGKHEKSSIVWSSLNGTTLPAMNLWESDWEETSFDFDIPTFALYQTQIDDYMTHNFNRAVNNAIEQYWTAYTTGANEVNNAKENSDDYASFSHINAYLAADYAHAMATNSIDAARANATNTIASQTTQHMNMRQNKQDQLDTKISYDNLMVTNAMNTAVSITSRKNQLATENMNGTFGDNTLLQYGTQAENATAIATTSNTNNANVLTGTVGGAVNGATSTGMAMAMNPNAASGLATAALTMGSAGAVAGSVVPGLGTAAGAVAGVAIGAVLGGLSGALSSNFQASTIADATMSNAIIATNSVQSIADATAIRNSFNLIRTNDANNDVTALNNGKLSYDNNQNHAMQQALLTLENQLDIDNYAAEYNAAVASRDNLYADTATQKGSEVANRDNARALAKAIADNIKSVTNSNAFNTRSVALRNYQLGLLASRDSGIAQMNDAANGKAITLANYSGDSAGIANKSQALTIRIKKQSESALQMAGSMFARYGYMLNQVWNVMESGLNLMRHFTYWKAGDIWLVNSEGGNAVQNETLRSIFRNGVTVWANPDDLGGVSIYDN